MKKILLFVPALFIAAVGTLNAQTIIFSEDFQTTSGTGVTSTIPTGWTRTQPASNTTSGWESGTSMGSAYFGIPSHTRYLAVNDDATQSVSTDPDVNNTNDLLTSPSFSLAGATYPQLVFDMVYYAATSPAEVGTVEVSTNNGTSWTVVQTLTGAAGWLNRSVSLTAYAGMTNVMVGFRYNSGAGWSYGMALDNVTVLEPVAKEVAINSIVLNKYVLVGSQNISTIIESYGGPSVTSVTLKYSVDGGTPVSQVFSGLSIGYVGTYTANFTTAASLTTAGYHTIKSWITDINGTGPDANAANDTATNGITVMASAPIKNVLIEEFTGVGCGYCPQGAITMHQEIASDPNVIWAAIHETGQGPDNMNIADGTTITARYDTGDPSYALDRSYMSTISTPGYNDAGILSSALMDVTPIAPRETAVVPATVTLSNVTFNSATRQISATVTANFVGSVKGNFALNCYVIEDRVYGPLAATNDNHWNQHSYFYTTTAADYYQVGSVTSPWSTAVAGLFPSVYQHDHVVEQFLGGPWGNTTVIPSTLVSAPASFSHTFTWTLPAGNTSNPAAAHVFNEDNISIIGMVEEYSSSGDKENGYILNAVQQKLNTNPETGLNGMGIEELSAAFGTVAVYPNPASVEANISIELKKETTVSISIYNSLGQMVFTENHPNLNMGDHLINFNTENLANGIYNIVVNTNNGSITKKITINK